jgi:hypothetical protein
MTVTLELLKLMATRPCFAPERASRIGTLTTVLGTRHCLLAD